MRNHHFNVILDAFWGSSGKGKMSAFLADKHDVRYVSSCNMPNAGHTVVLDTEAIINKVMPSASHIPGVEAVFLGPGSAFTVERFQQEQDWLHPDIFLYVHERASIVEDRHRTREAETAKHVASTMQGSSAALSDKISRVHNVTLARHAPITGVETGQVFRQRTYDALMNGSGVWLHEIAQGHALSIDHGSHYPQCTSRNCGTQAAMDQMAIPPDLVGDVYLNLRTFPIRVGDIVEDGATVGKSGGFWPDSVETTWERVAKDAGMPDGVAAGLAQRERTTVTKRVRRVCSFSVAGAKEAAFVNGATKLLLNFVQYIDWSNHKATKLSQLTARTRRFIDSIEDQLELRIVAIGTGAHHTDIIDCE